MSVEDQLALITRLVYRANKHNENKRFRIMHNERFINLNYFSLSSFEEYFDETVYLDSLNNPTVPLSTWIEILKKYSPEENVH